MSPLDAQYRLGVNSSEAPAAAQVYRRGIRQTLGSTCQWLPSDSEFTLRKSTQCGTLRAGALGIARYLSEYDAPRLVKESVIRDQKMYFFDFSSSCDLF